MAIQAMFQPEIWLIGAQKTRTVMTAKGMADHCMKGMRRPRLFFERSESEATSGSVTASKTRQRAVIRPRTVRNPPMTRPGTIKRSAPASMSPLVGR